VGRKNLYISLVHLCISSEEICISFADLYISAREIYKLERGIHISPKEIGKWRKEPTCFFETGCWKWLSKGRCRDMACHVRREACEGAACLWREKFREDMVGHVPTSTLAIPF